MGKLRQATLILGEGPTEFFYFKSLCDVFKRLTIKPDYPKHTSIKELDLKIAEGMAMGYSHIFCVIDMDTKNIEPERSQYQKLKTKYAKPINKPKKGIYCKVEFFETHRCTDLFFLYYFRYTSRSYEEQESLIKDLNKFVEYQKTTDFFIKSKGLHSYFERHGGNLVQAIANANRSMDEKLSSGRDYTYSELGRLMRELKKLELY
ncbi:RloB family protein [uncultured Bacteroides sp.]|uniref:RloB family protein n=1 Tax=uncultured Bacteroides sp. TaxID=162156 RepID=UPI00260EA22A|nr:RloB family protein [uncultured Bacteroides sp.]